MTGLTVRDIYEQSYRRHREEQFLFKLEERVQFSGVQSETVRLALADNKRHRTELYHHAFDSGNESLNAYYGAMRHLREIMQYRRGMCQPYTQAIHFQINFRQPDFYKERLQIKRLGLRRAVAS